MNAHQLDSNGLIINTIVVDSLSDFPNLVNASIGGGIGDSIINGVLVRKPAVVPSLSINAPIVTDSFNASLRRKAAKLQENGDSFKAVQLLLQAQGVKS
jgi:hypothetical protein